MTAAVAALAAVGSAVFTGVQASFLASQIEQSNVLHNATVLGAVTVSAEGASFKVTNRSMIRLETAGLWVIGDNGDNELLEVLGSVESVPACAAMTVDLTDVLGDYDIVEALTVVELPSGKWHLLASGGRSEAIDYEGSSAVEALESSRQLQVSSDTYWEGADGVDTVTLEYPVVAHAPRTGQSPAPSELTTLSTCS